MAIAAIQVMDLSSLKAVMTEFNKEIIPSRFEKAQQINPSTLQLGLRTLNGLFWIEISWQADAPRLVQVLSPPRQGNQSTLAKQMQYSLRQMALIEVKQKGFERIVEFGFSSRPGEAIQKTLILEMMGRHSNLLLLDSDQRVITLGKQIRNHQSRIRPISTGDPYISPPPLKGKVPNSEEPESQWKKRLCLVPSNLLKALQNSYQGISPSLALQIADEKADKAKVILKRKVSDLSNQDWSKIHSRWRLWLTQLEKEELSIYFDGPTDYRVWKEKNNSSSKIKSVSLLLGEYYKKNLEKKELNQISRELRQSLLRLIKIERSELSQQETRLKDASNNKHLQQKADELLCKQSPTKDTIEKAQKLYQKAKKYRRSEKIIKQRIIYHSQRLEIIEESQNFLENILENPLEENSKILTDLENLRRELNEFLIQPKNKQRKSSHHNDQLPQPLEIKTPFGLLIQIGRNHKQNEWISFRKAKPGDLWFHAQECPGSHVVLKSSAGLAEDSDLQIAADIAAYFSRARRNKQVPVVMVPINQLQRIPGAIKGTVRHRGGEICWAEPDRALNHISTSKLLAN